MVDKCRVLKFDGYFAYFDSSVQIVKNTTVDKLVIAINRIFTRKLILILTFIKVFLIPEEKGKFLDI